MHKNCDYIAYLYAQDETIGIKHIKEGNYSLDCDTTTTADYMDKYGIRYMVCDGIDYHKKCDSIAGKPYIFYFMGNISLLDKEILGIVGPRVMSGYAHKTLDLLFTQLDGLDIATISGGAMGVDTYAHTLSLKYSIPTIVVLGGGIGYYLRSGKRTFLEKIVASGGLVLSDYKLFYSPRVYTFPQRNRIIAGLSTAIFVPEAREKSGSLLTVDIAHKQHIPIYASMQDIFCETSIGTNKYIQQGIIKPLQDMNIFIDACFSSSITTRKNNLSLFCHDDVAQQVKHHSVISQAELIYESMQELGIS